ncbi:hypothetical protein J2Y45_000101 [Dyadobacter sp. BE34]|uniref:DUF5618 domain-containing protein n=1 Tax=Dyadobacter fermentans TaxID=94254 RepID=A0ABU1R7K7_9BACT|nr:MULTISPECIES: DUF5618 family protein [Dyadobacter]MDR6809348.1 hypothetical protein [Dyadobacter fermentans]MDR7047058.1 hypothetical protein [Dyadobacter sp. BE242]MDR7194975.1 hypothetical protein [Dyadobacter sp. BE34]MDR7214480.1 hypothetical protein [Dyadobacter sp. BE31]MDR7266897.1 hypothetical protein [Dyadobacter sp. BE32]
MEVINEAKRYIDNARVFLRDNARKENGVYQDTKYVKIAGHTAYSGVLIALDAVLPEKGSRKSVEWYQKELSAIDKRVLSSFLNTYHILHIGMGYDGAPNAKTANIGLQDAERIIHWVENRLEKKKR